MRATYLGRKYIPIRWPSSFVNEYLIFRVPSTGALLFFIWELMFPRSCREDGTNRAARGSERKPFESVNRERRSRLRVCNTMRRPYGSGCRNSSPAKDTFSFTNLARYAFISTSGRSWKNHRGAISARTRKRRSRGKSRRMIYEVWASRRRKVRGWVVVRNEEDGKSWHDWHVWNASAGYSKSLVFASTPCKDT